MKQEFATLYGRIIIERDVLYLHAPYLPFEKTAFAQVAYELLWMALFAMRLFGADTPTRIVITVIFGLLVLSRLPNMYDKFFKRSYASRISLSSIRNFTVKDDHHGLQTELKLQLRNGRYKSIIFRKLENQLEPFIAYLSGDAALLAKT
jgi:hypothetical protein